MPLYNPIDSTAITDGTIATADLADGAVTAAKMAAPSVMGYMASGRYYFASAPGAVGTSSTLGVGTIRLAPWFVPNACVLSRIGAEIQTAGEAGSKLRLGIYSDDGTGQPGTLLLDAGTIAGDSNTVQEITINQAITPGMYWIGGAVQVVSVTQPTVRTCNSPPVFGPVSPGTSAPTAGMLIFGWALTSVAGAFPSNGAFGASQGQPPRVFVKVA